MDRLLQGDRVAFLKLSRLITGYLVQLRAYDFRDEWDDLIQEVVWAAVEAARSKRLRKPGAVPAYVRSATRFKFTDRLRRKRLVPVEPEVLEERADENGGGGQDLDGSVQLREALGRLPEKQRQAVVSVYVEGNTYEQASRETGIPLGTLKRHLRLGLAALHESLSRQMTGA